MKTKGMSQQVEALQLLNGREFFALFMEMGTGKTWTILADAERQYAAGKIEGLVVIAPKGVHTNWIRREIPTHLSAEHIAAAYYSGGGKRKAAAVERLFKPRALGEQPPLRILAVNIDAINTKKGFEVVSRFLRCIPSMLVIDESDRIKNGDSGRTKQIMRLKELSVTRRICSGAPLDKPVDLFSQMEFLDEGLLGTTSKRAFIAEYAELLPDNHGLMRHIVARGGNSWAKPQIVAKNPDGTPKWRNLDKLRALLMPHSFRKLKRECLDLPEKIYKTQFFELTSAQRAVYTRLDEEQRIELMEGQITVVEKLAAGMKLQQVTSGFVNIEGEPLLLPSEDNPRMDALVELVESIHTPFIVWARFREEIRQIAEVLNKAGVAAVEYHGGIGTQDREDAVDRFQAGAARAFVGNPQAGGIGLTLTAAQHVIYYSNDFSLLNRLQSEDRAHRIGTKTSVVYTDLVAEDTIDEGIVRSLQNKEDVAQKIMGDNLPRSVQSDDN